MSERPADKIKMVKQTRDVEPDEPYIPKPTWRCRILGHKFHRWEHVDSWVKAKITYSECQRCGIKYMPDIRVSQ